MGARRVPLLFAYLGASLVLVGAYPLLRGAGRTADFMLISFAAAPALLLGLRGIPVRRRRAWVLLLVAVVVVNLANVIGLVPGPRAMAVGRLVNTSGNLFVLAAALALVLRHGRNELGVILDTTIVGLALGSILWDLALWPRLEAVGYPALAQVELFVVIFALCGVLGALARLALLCSTPMFTLWLLVIALGLALTGNIILAARAGTTVSVPITMIFMGAYALIGLFGLDPGAARLAALSLEPREDVLSFGRLVFLGCAVAAIPVGNGVRALVGLKVDGLVLALGGATIAALVMVRIGNLSAQRTRAERALRWEATHDPLTSLPNRRSFVARLDEDLAQGYRCEVFFCDLDGFKAVNDRFGHVGGDELLIEVARRLRTCVGHTDVVSRFGGDEFLILFHPDLVATSQVFRERVADALVRPIAMQGDLVPVGASIGVAAATGELDPEAVINRADRAMYRAKRDVPVDRAVRIVTG